MSSADLSQDQLLEQATEFAVREMWDRLQEAPKDIATRDLINMITYASKVLEKREQALDEGEHKPFDLWEELPSMPYFRAKELVLEEIDRLEAELKRYEQWLTKEETGGFEG